MAEATQDRIRERLTAMEDQARDAVQRLQDRMRRAGYAALSVKKRSRDARRLESLVKKLESATRNRQQAEKILQARDQVLASTMMVTSALAKKTGGSDGAE